MSVENRRPTELFLIRWTDFRNGETGTLPPARPWHEACDLVVALNRLFQGYVGHSLDDFEVLENGEENA